MAALNGTWILEKSENFEEFMKELGKKDVSSLLNFIDRLNYYLRCWINSKKSWKYSDSNINYFQ